MQKASRAILIVDDDSRNIFALSAVLKSKGFHTLAAPGMKEAFELLKQNSNVGIILLDMMMPDMDGYEALPVLKRDEKWAAIPVVAVTAQAMTGDRERCLSAGADGYLSKPVDVEQLLQLLKEHLK